KRKEQKRKEQKRKGYHYVKAFFGIANLFSKKLYLYSLTILSALFVLVNSHGAIHVYLKK
ncbi:hypothetical protein, partial [Brachyspira aalborgi]